MRAIRRVAKSGQVSIPPEIMDLLGIEPGDYIEFDVLRKVEKADIKAKGESENPLEAFALALA